MSEPAAEQTGAWHPNLTMLGYCDPLPAPSPAVQATLAGIRAPNIHEYIMTQDRAALDDVDEEGAHAPLLLATLDMSQWTLILNTVIRTSTEKALEQLQTAYNQLADILDWEAETLEESEKSAELVDEMLKKANPHEKSKSSQASALSTAASHPFLSGLNVEPSQAAALEDLAENILSSQVEKDRALLLATGQGPVAPYTPSCSVEVQLNEKGNRCWGLPNINLLAPISIPMWRTWANLPQDELDTLRSQALNGTALLREGVFLPGAFPLNFYDHKKCSTHEVRVHTKQDLSTGAVRDKKFTSAVWNCQRPYLRCICKGTRPDGCQGDVIWFDHAVWFMLNNLDSFFGEEHPTLAAKFAAFVVWLSDAARIAVRYQVVFQHIREIMLDSALQLARNPQAKITEPYPNAAGVRKIERFLKPASFSAVNPSILVANKRPRATINCNVSPDGRQYATPPNSHRNAYRPPASGGRGSYNRKFKPTPGSAPALTHQTSSRRDNPNAPGDNDAFVFYTNGCPNQPPLRTPNNGSRLILPSASQTHSEPLHNRTGSRPNRQTMKRRFLDWDNM